MFYQPPFMQRIFSLLLGFLLLVQVHAQNVNYYSSINTTATGSTLETALTNLITTTHTTNISYSTAFQLLKDANEDAANTSNVILIYNGVSDPKTNSYGGGGTGTASTGWTREHIFPKSLANPNLGTTGPGADAHNLAPCTNSINGARGNKMYEAGSGTYGSVSTTGWYPGDDWRGDVARAIFYMEVRYGSQCDITNVASLSLLLQWNAADPVSALEDQRNDEIYSVQGNRNPFIDNPIFATRIWGGPTAQDRFTSAISDPTSFVLSAATNSVSFAATANSNGDDVVLAVTNASGSFGVPTGTYTAGSTISGGGSVLYVGPAANIPDHTGLSAASIYKYKIWSVNSGGTYSNGIEKTISTLGGALSQLFKNSFESSPDDTWSYTANPAAYNVSGDIWDVVSSNGSINAGSDGANFWAIRDLNNSNGGGSFFHILEFQTIDISNNTNVDLSFDYYAEAFESTDELEYELFYDGVSQGAVTIFQGGTGGLSTNAWQSISLSIPDAVNQLQLHLRAKQDGGSDYGGFDNVVLESAVSPPSLSVSAYSPTAAQLQLTANNNGDSVLVIYGSGLNQIFAAPSGLYSAGQNYQGQATVAYFGPVTSLSPITRLSEGADYTFTAYSFTGSSYSAAMSQNLSLPQAEGSGTQELFFQGFESSGSDTWSINTGSAAVSNADGAADYPPLERIRTGSNSWQVNNASETLELQNVSCSAADSLTLTFYLSSTALTSGNGADASDYLKVYLNLNNAGFSTSPLITINGNNNAKWGFEAYNTGSGTNTSAAVIQIDDSHNVSYSPSGGGYRDVDAYYKIVIGLNGVSNLALKIEAFNNSDNEIWNIDDISLQSSSNAIVWNGSEWKNGEEPDQTTDARRLIVYPGEDAELYQKAILNSLDLRSNARLRIGSTGGLQINSIDAADGELILEADNLGSASYIGPSILLTKEYYISRAGWQSISFPFSNLKFQDIEFNNGGLISYASSAGQSACSTCNLFYYDGSISNPNNIGASGSTAYGTWIAVHDSTANVSTAYGYYLKLGTANFGTVPMLISVSGTTLSGNQQLSTEDGNGGWNLLPNPFPTALSWSSKTDLNSEGFDQAYWIYDGSNFATYNGGVGVNGADGYIPSGQAFFVHSSSALIGTGRNTRNLALGTGMRAQNNRSRHKISELDILRLVASIDTTFNAEIALALSAEASEDYLPEEDAISAGADAERDFNFQTSLGNALVIRKDPNFQGLKTFPLQIGSELLQSGALTLSAALSGKYAYLLDANKTLVPLVEGEGLRLNTLQSPISLVLSDRTISQADFEIVYWSSQDGEAFIYSLNAWEKLEVYDQTGQLIISTADHAYPFQLDLASHHGAFIVRIEYANEAETLKLLR